MLLQDSLIWKFSQALALFFQDTLKQTVGSAWVFSIILSYNCCPARYSQSRVVVIYYLPLSVMGRGKIMSENSHNSPVHFAACLTVLVQSHSATTTDIISDKQCILKTLPHI